MFFSIESCMEAMREQDGFYAFINDSQCDHEWTIFEQLL